MRRTVATVLTALVATLPLVAGALPAGAESVTVDDASGDVSDGRWRGGTGHDTVDIVHTTLDHQTRRVVLKIDVVELAGPGGNPLTAQGRLRLPDGSERWLVLQTDGRAGKTVVLENGSREVVACEGIAGALRRDTDRVVMSAPRSCLGDPDWIRFTAGMTVSWGRVNARDDARRRTGMSLPQQFMRRLGPEKVRPGAVD